MIQKKKNMEFPTAFIGFDSNEAFVNVCLYCSDFDLDVLEIFINGANFLCFFNIEDFDACCFYCQLNSFSVEKYVLLQKVSLFHECLYYIYLEMQKKL